MFLRINTEQHTILHYAMQHPINHSDQQGENHQSARFCATLLLSFLDHLVYLIYTYTSIPTHLITIRFVRTHPHPVRLTIICFASNDIISYRGISYSSINMSCHTVLRAIIRLQFIESHFNCNISYTALQP